MKKYARLLIFVLAFQMEVRVRASGELLQQPADCLEVKEACAIQVLGSGFHLLKGSVKLHAASGAALVRQSETRWRLVKGALWVENGSSVEVDTVYGSITSSRGQYWVIEQQDQVLVRNMNADLRVTLRDGRSLDLPDGFEFWMAGVDTKGKSKFGMIRPVDMKEHLPMWNSLYRGSKEAFIKDVVQLRENWGDLAEKSGALYETLAKREIASEVEKEQALLRAKQKQAEQRRQVKDLYYKRVFER